MLVDITRLVDKQVLHVLSESRGGSVEIVRHMKGVYEIGHFSFGIMLGDLLKEEYPEDIGVHCCGVSDNVDQVLTMSNIQLGKRLLVVSFTKVEKSKQPPTGGWRWHKWGPYIGKQEITSEYLYHEKEIDMVYVYHVFEVDGIHIWGSCPVCDGLGKAVLSVY